MSGYTLFRLFKYVLFGLFIYNFYVYLGEDLDAYRYLPANSPIGRILETFAVTIDFVAWMVLVVLFELETDVRTKEKLQGKLKWFFKGAVAICYPVLIYAFYGYVIALVDFLGYEPIANETVCELVDRNYAYLSMEARYLPLDQAKCAEFTGVEIFKHQTDNVISPAAPLAASVKLAWIDVANAGAWLLVVLLFEVEVIYLARGALTRRWLIAIKAGKAALYLTLIGDAIFWTFYGTFVDSWDAYLWIVAFVTIDLNVFDFKMDSSSSEPTSEKVIQGAH